MFSVTTRLLFLIATIAATISAADIQGQIIIKRKLSKRTVTAPANAYARGTMVAPPVPTDEDPLAFERRRVVIFLEGELPSERQSVTLEQANRRFVPDLVVIPAGSTVSFPNRDAIFHNVFSLSRTKAFDLGTYPKDQTRQITLADPGVVYVNCHLHPNMTAAIVVTPNRWNTRADESGQFRLPDVPPGRHTVVAWHKTVGFFRQTVDIDADRNAAVSFLIPFQEEEPEPKSVRR